MLSLPIAEGTVVAGKYRVERVLGRGGMGVVFSAWHLELDQRIALKFLSEELAENLDATERFRREARAVAQIKSEHVVRVLDVGILGEKIPYLVMEYLEGQDLEEEVTQRGRLPIAEVIDYTLQAIEAVAEAHAAGIVHRDLKPGNLFLLSRRDGTRMIKVLDFGISKALAGGSSSEQLALTATASLIGSPLYMSPEQMQSPRRVDQRTDIWSLGAIVYRALSGQPPYPAETIAQLCTMVLSSQPTPLSELRPEVPPGLQEAVAGCLERDLEKRIQNVSQLATALAPFGSELSKVHVSRAARILSIKEPAAGGEASPGAGGGHGTQNSWHRDQPKGGRVSKRVALLSGLVFFPLLGATLAFWPRKVEPEIAAGSAVIPIDAPAISPPIESTARPEAAKPEPSAVATASVGGASGTAGAMNAPPQTPAAPTPAALPPARFAPRSAPAAAAARPAVPAQVPRVGDPPPRPDPPAREPGGLTDFGGRR